MLLKITGDLTVEERKMNLGIRTSIIWSEDGEHIAMVKVNGVIERIPH